MRSDPLFQKDPDLASARVISFDSDFSRFPGLRWERPGG
jgi:hypothetical protein